jgi:hypothetical protein
MRGLSGWAINEWQRIGLKKKRRNKRVDAKEMQFLVTKLKIDRPRKPYGWTVIQSHLVRALEEFFEFTLTSSALQILKTYINTETREQASESLYEPKPPAYFQWEKMKKVWNRLWHPAPRGPLETRHKVVCVSYICYVTVLMIEDLEEKMEEGVTFLRMPLRVSKSNTKKTRRESLILISRPTDIMLIMKRLRASIGKRTKGKVFPEMDTRKVTHHLKRAAKDLGWKELPRAHGMRLGYILNSSIGGVEDDHIVNACRWKDTAMLRYYRNHFLENTKHGAAYRISKSNEEARLRDQRLEKQTATTSTQTEPLQPEKPKIQTMFRVIKKMSSTETQTEDLEATRREESDDEFEGGIYQNFLSMRTRTCTYLRTD